MKKRPILFSAPMVLAILDGKKTQTRRVLKNAPPDTEFFSTYHHPNDERRGQHFYAVAAGALTSFAVPCPYGQPGDRLWVRETWQHANSPHGPYEPSCTCFYRADYWDDPHGMDGEKSPEGKYRTWIPSIHMFRSASRITLEVVTVRVERLHDISDADALDEGIKRYSFRPDDGWPLCDGYTHLPDDGKCTLQPTAAEAYRELWASINGTGSWDANPWVWVVEFKRVDS